MLVAEEAVEIRVLRRQGKSIREIARMLEVSRNTVQRYLRGEGLYVLLASQLSPEGLKVDRDTANTRVGTWLREVANARLHATTGEVALVRLELERERVQPMPRPWPGLIQFSQPA